MRELTAVSGTSLQEILKTQILTRILETVPFRDSPLISVSTQARSLILRFILPHHQSTGSKFTGSGITKTARAQDCTIQFPWYPRKISPTASGTTRSTWSTVAIGKCLRVGG